jgi:hypothetical protein
VTRVIVVPGTWGREQDWYRPWSPWARYLVSLGVEVFEPNGRPFLWSTDAGGWQGWRRWFGRTSTRDHWDWMAGGDALFNLIVPPLAPERRIPPAETRVISHSHGLQVVLYACAYGLKIDTLIDIAGPVRADMRPILDAARPNIRQWLHVHSDGSDKMQWLGELGDGTLGIVRGVTLPGVVNHALPKAGHSGVLRDPVWFPRFWPGAVDWMGR